MKCRCEELYEITGVEAEEYARKHLIKIRTNGVVWRIEYKCPETGIHWIMDFPYGGAHGGGPPRLRRRPPND
ncbi:MAG: hypothetical protein H5U03_01370 [Clostridia bacterium]|nr:hypothetical protein [Clostridia bacterium]